MTTRDSEPDDGRVLWGGTERDGDHRRFGAANSEARPPARNRPGSESESGRDGRSGASESGRDGRSGASGDGGPPVRRRAVLKGLGSGAVVTGLAGCQTDDPGRTDPPGRTEPPAPTEPGTATDEPGDGTETPEDGRTETPEDGTETPEDGDGSEDGSEEGNGTQTDAQFFEKRVDCPQGCGEGECVLIMKFSYDFERADDGTIDVSRFRLRFLERATTRNCAPEFRGASGTFEFDVAGEQPCSVGPREVGLCECGLRVQFEDLAKGDDEDCICPDPTETPPPQCSPDPLWIERTGDLESITIDIEQRAICSCQNDAKTFSINVQVRYQDGEISFGGDTRDS